MNIQKAVRDAARELLRRDPLRRGPWLIPDEELRKYLNYKRPCRLPESYDEIHKRAIRKNQTP